MSQQIDTKTRTFQAAAAIAIHLRVKDNGSGKLAAAGATDIELGTMAEAAVTADDYYAVNLRSKEGTTKMVASAAITRGGNIYGAASGKVSSTANSNRIGIALETVTADGDVIEVLRDDIQKMLLPTGEAHTANDTLTAAELQGHIHTSVGATGAITLALPAATVGLNGWFRVGAAQELRLDPNGTETIALPSTGVQAAAGKYLTANADGETVRLLCDTAGDWSCYGYTGTWTAET